MGKCRCGHYRGSHRRMSGKYRIPCQARVRQERGSALLGVPTRWVEITCKCRDFVPVSGAPARAEGMGC